MTWRCQSVNPNLISVPIRWAGHQGCIPVARRYGTAC